MALLENALINFGIVHKSYKRFAFCKVLAIVFPAEGQAALMQPIAKVNALTC